MVFAKQLEPSHGIDSPAVQRQMHRLQLNKDGAEHTINRKLFALDEEKKSSGSNRRLNSLSRLDSGMIEDTTVREALQYMRDFEQSQIELVPKVSGHLFLLKLTPTSPRGRSKSQSPPNYIPSTRKAELRYVELDPSSGDLIFYKKKEDLKS